jgi:hypothetical protein
VLFDGVEHQVVALDSTLVRLVDTDGMPSVVLLGHLLASPGFAILGAAEPTGAPPLDGQLLHDVPAEIAARARGTSLCTRSTAAADPPSCPACRPPTTHTGQLTRSHGRRSRVSEAATQRLALLDKR